MKPLQWLVGFPIAIAFVLCVMVTNPRIWREKLLRW